MNFGYWIAVDLDGTLAEYTHWVSSTHIGKPIPRMVARVKGWIEDGKDVRIFTARIGHEAYDFVSPFPEYEAERDAIIKAIQDWCLLYIGKVLPVTCKKDYGMVELWDDRCVQLISNTGLRADGKD